jgi:hypothetical protein
MTDRTPSRSGSQRHWCSGSPAAAFLVGLTASTASCATTVEYETDELVGPSRTALEQPDRPPLLFEWTQAGGRLTGKGRWDGQCVTEQTSTLVKEKVTTTKSYAGEPMAVAGILLIGVGVYLKVSPGDNACSGLECTSDAAFVLGAVLGAAGLAAAKMKPTVQREPVSRASQVTHERAACGLPRDLEGVRLVVMGANNPQLRLEGQVGQRGEVAIELPPLAQPVEALIAVSSPPPRQRSIVARGLVVGRIVLVPWEREEASAGGDPPPPSPRPREQPRR